MRRWLLLLFLATMAVDWPRLPFNARLADFVFGAAAVAILVSQKTWVRPRFTILDIAILGYLAGSAPAVIFSPEPRASGLELVRQLYLAAIYVVIAVGVRQGFAMTVASGIALSGALLAALGVAAFLVHTIFGVGTTALTPVMTLPYVGETVRISALTATPAMLACVLAMAIPFVALHPFVMATRRRTVAAATVLGLATVLTYSHSAAGVVVSTLIASWHSLRPHRPLRTAAAALTAVVVIALNFAASVSIRSIGDSRLRDDTVFQYGVDQGRAEIAGVNIEYQTMSYLRIKQVALDAFRSAPLFGVGLDRFHGATEIAYAQGRLTANYRAIDPHSSFFGRLAEAGVAGGITLIALWIAIAVTIDRLRAQQGDDWILLAAAAGIIGTLVNSMNADVMNFRFLWVALGLLRGLNNIHGNTEAQKHGNPVLGSR
jgi:O-Antigen ligase